MTLFFNLDYKINYFFKKDLIYINKFGIKIYPINLNTIK